MWLPFSVGTTELVGAPSMPWVSNAQLLFAVRIQSSGSMCMAQPARWCSGCQLLLAWLGRPIASRTDLLTSQPYHPKAWEVAGPGEGLHKELD